jgi:hypothetical protein
MARKFGTNPLSYPFLLFLKAQPRSTLSLLLCSHYSHRYEDMEVSGEGRTFVKLHNAGLGRFVLLANSPQDGGAVDGCGCDQALLVRCCYWSLQISDTPRR